MGRREQIIPLDENHPAYLEIANSISQILKTAKENQKILIYCKKGGIIMINLGKNEQETLRVKKHWMFFFWPLFFTIFTSGLASPWLLYRVLRYFFDEIIITNKKFHISIGIISRNATSTPLPNINNVSYSQGVLGRILGYGTVYVQSAALLGMSSYSYIKEPAFVKASLEDTIAHYDERHTDQIVQAIKELPQHMHTLNQ